jgi:hypothetical protein
MKNLKPDNRYSSIMKDGVKFENNKTQTLC